MRAEDLKKLILDEQSRRPDFINARVDEYVAKLIDKAEFIAAFQKEICQGFVAYYCNDVTSKIAFITLVLVVPEYRGIGLGETLVKSALEQSRKKGAQRCRLEVNTNNIAALSLYKKLGFVDIESRTSNFLLEARL